MQAQKDILNHMFPEELSKDYPEVVSFFSRALIKNKLANSYVFVGNNDSINLLFAKTIAKILNCSKNKDSLKYPCNQCTNCIWLEKNEHPQAFVCFKPDQKKPDQKSKKEQIKIDSVRELLAALKITSDAFRVIFFQNADLNSLPPESCNLLLKTVEETPEKILFIFANSSKHDILPTILSRSQTIYINKNHDSIKEILTDRTTDTLDSQHYEYSFKNKVESLEKAEEIKVYLEKNYVDLTDYLKSIACKYYEKTKYNHQKEYCFLYKNLTNAYSKHKAFMQPKIIIEDLFLSLAE